MARFLIQALGYWAAFALVALAGWIGDTFGDPSLDQILYHLHYSEGVAVRMSGLFVFTFVMQVLLFPLAFAALAAFVHTRLKARPHLRIRRVLPSLPRAALGVGVFALLLKFSVFSYAAALFGPDRFGAAYVNPARVQPVPERPRNLVLIYVESLEDTYGNAQVFGRDLLSPLRAAGGVSFPEYRPQPGTTWTMAAMVATQCGVPLTVYSEDDMRPASHGREFLPGAVCLGDILAAHGYRNVFLGGVSLAFAGKGRFLRDHGYQDARGEEEWESAGMSAAERNEWGLYDGALLTRARLQLDQLHAAGQPFNLTLLTLNTHNPNGFLSPKCRARGAVDFEGIVECVSAQVADFVQFARDRGYLRDTAIVVVGDHLAVPNPVWDKLQRAPRRGIFNLLVTQPAVERNTDVVVPFDFFPTLLQLAGFRVPGDRLGLGYTALGPAQVPRPAEREPIALAGLHGSAVYRGLWNPRED
jgi:phosphoglycerol transferase